jgi:hypothetical protein
VGYALSCKFYKGDTTSNRSNRTSLRFFLIFRRPSVGRKFLSRRVNSSKSKRETHDATETKTFARAARAILSARTLRDRLMRDFARRKADDQVAMNFQGEPPQAKEKLRWKLAAVISSLEASRLNLKPRGRSIQDQDGCRVLAAAPTALPACIFDPLQ